jgi:hypothetical protein
VTIGATAQTVSESSQAPGEFTVYRAAADLSQPLTVLYSIAGTATNGSDYSTLTGSVQIPAGADRATITVTPVQDGQPEDTESVELAIANTQGYAVGGVSGAYVQIIDNTAPPEAGAPGTPALPNAKMFGTGSLTEYSGTVTLTAGEALQVRALASTLSDAPANDAQKTSLLFNTTYEWHFDDPRTATMSGDGAHNNVESLPFVADPLGEYNRKLSYTVGLNAAHVWDTPTPISGAGTSGYLVTLNTFAVNADGTKGTQTGTGSIRVNVLPVDAMYKTSMWTSPTLKLARCMTGRWGVR